MHDLFISHASEDKAAIARPLAEALINRGLSVWYDEFSLRLGDSLRSSIERGLSDSSFGVVILSPAFFEKKWTIYELNGITSLDVELGKTLLPVWHGINKQDLLRIAPALSDRVAVSTRNGVEHVADEISGVFGQTARPRKPLNANHSEAISPANFNVTKNVGWMHGEIDVTFDLVMKHGIKLTYRPGLVGSILQLFVDGKEIYAGSFSSVFSRSLDHPFYVEKVRCRLAIASRVIWGNGKLYVGDKPVITF